MSKIDEEKFNTNIKQSLDDSVDALDANTLSKIRQVRAEAIDRAKHRHVNWSGLLVGGLATTCVMVIAVVVLLNSSTSMQTVPAVDIELISSSDNLEFYEDLEFYEWLEEDGLQS